LQRAGDCGRGDICESGDIFNGGRLIHEGAPVSAHVCGKELYSNSPVFYCQLTAWHSSAFASFPGNRGARDRTRSRRFEGFGQSPIDR
jgi:hypothetical protein